MESTAERIYEAINKNDGYKGSKEERIRIIENIINASLLPIISDVEIVLTSSEKPFYVNDDQRIGFQKGAKWMRQRLRNIQIADGLQVWFRPPPCQR